MSEPAPNSVSVSRTATCPAGGGHFYNGNEFMSRLSGIDSGGRLLRAGSVTRRPRRVRIGLLTLACLLLGMLTACGNDHQAASLVAQAPLVTSNPANQTVQAGQTATFSVVATGSAPLAYQWQRGTVSIAGATGTSYTTPATVVGDSGATYAAVGSNASGSATSATATLTVIAVVTVTITQQPLNRSVASGAQAAFTVAATCSDPSTPPYQWQPSNHP